jgi:hypothetical protein
MTADAAAHTLLSVSMTQRALWGGPSLFCKEINFALSEKTSSFVG